MTNELTCVDDMRIIDTIVKTTTIVHSALKDNKEFKKDAQSISNIYVALIYAVILIQVFPWALTQCTADTCQGLRIVSRRGTSVFTFLFRLYVHLLIKYFNFFFQDQEEPEGDVEVENGNSADEASSLNAQRSSPSGESHDQSPPVTDQIPPLDNSDTVENETTKLLNEESDWAPSVLVPRNMT